MLPLLKKSTQITECQICQNPLGSESRDLGYYFCHNHRICGVCEEPITARESKWCFESYLDSLKENENLEPLDIEVIHPRCQKVPFEPRVYIKQSEYDFLNLLRLTLIPQVELSSIENENNAALYGKQFLAGMDYERKALHLKRLEAYVEVNQSVLRQDPQFNRKYIEERDKEHASKAKQEKVTSSRPVGRKPEAPKELQLGAFMELHGFTERKTAQKLMNRWNDAINSLMKLGVPETEAREQCTQDLIKSGVFPK